MSAQELHTFAETNMVADWLTPEEMVTAAKAAGWGNVEFVDLTPDIRLSFQVACSYIRVCECVRE